MCISLAFYLVPQACPRCPPTGGSGRTWRQEQKFPLNFACKVIGRPLGSYEYGLVRLSGRRLSLMVSDAVVAV